MDKLKLVKALLEDNGNSCEDAVWKVGEKYIIRTVTMIQLGRLAKVTEKELLLEPGAAWIADTGRFHECLANGTFNEIEMFNPNYPVIVGRGSVIDAQKWGHSLPETSK